MPLFCERKRTLDLALLRLHEHDGAHTFRVFLIKIFFLIKKNKLRCNIIRPKPFKCKAEGKVGFNSLIVLFDFHRFFLMMPMSWLSCWQSLRSWGSSTCVHCAFTVLTQRNRDTETSQRIQYILVPCMHVSQYTQPTAFSLRPLCTPVELLWHCRRPYCAGSAATSFLHAQSVHCCLYNMLYATLLSQHIYWWSHSVSCNRTSARPLEFYISFERCGISQSECIKFIM